MDPDRTRDDFELDEYAAQSAQKSTLPLITSNLNKFAAFNYFRNSVPAPAELVPISISLPSGQHLLMQVPVSKTNDVGSNSPMVVGPGNAVQLQLATGNSGQAYVKKLTPQKRKLRQKSPYLSNLSIEISEMKSELKSVLSPETRIRIEKQLCSFIEEFEKCGRRVDPCLRRFRQKLNLISRKEELKLKSFDFDGRINKVMKADDLHYERDEYVRFKIDKNATVAWCNTFHSNQKLSTEIGEDNSSSCSFSNVGSTCQEVNSDKLEIISGCSLSAKLNGLYIGVGKQKTGLIWRDYKTEPLMKRILKCIKTSPDYIDTPIDYVYFRKDHVVQVNDLLRKHLYPGIDVSDELGDPSRVGILAIHSKKVIGCCFFEYSTMAAYLSYLVVETGWQGSGVGKKLLYFALALNPTKDYLLHCQCINWKALSIYSSCGFKPEKFCVGFYDKYVPWQIGLAPNEWNTSGSRNAFLMRCRQRGEIKLFL